jgi:hypothetical protein
VLSNDGSGASVLVMGALAPPRRLFFAPIDFSLQSPFHTQPCLGIHNAMVTGRGNRCPLRLRVMELYERGFDRKD